MNKDDKSKTLIKLGFYMLFLLVVIILIVTSGIDPNKNQPNSNNTDNSIDTNKTLQKTYLDKQKDLITGNYKYKFVIDDGNIVFEGVSKNGVRVGTKNTYNKKIEYQKDSDIYIIENGQKQLYENLYDEVDENLFNFTDIFEKLNVLNCIIDRRDDETVYSYKDVLSYDFDIIVNQENIIRIDIRGEHVYNMLFNY